ncbi:cytokine receptor common subunit beta isoform X2 [Genypterus blacodes]|uniref:cytokine receptor common subunit beta isoform X2 n=1 Tax=Genypterus blacodes TaxID=154954 RepID=UPI003F76D3C9
MMPLLWVLLQSVIPLLAVGSDPHICPIQEGSAQSASPWLQSLRCHNDYWSYVRCSWEEEPHSHTPLQLWVLAFNKSSASLCERDAVSSQAADTGHRSVQCTHHTRIFANTISHRFFFRPRTQTVCPSALHKPLELLQHLRVHPPVKLSTHGTADGGRALRWSSPYPSSPNLSKNLTYQLSHRREGQEEWTVNNVTSTHMKLEGPSLSPGSWYEARVRARAAVGRWSVWSPVISWQAAESHGHIPMLQCVLDGEKEVTCSWEVKRELAQFITYQLTCRHSHAAEHQRCCVNPTVTSDSGRAALTYSCRLTVTDPAHRLLELQPAHIIKTFRAHRNIRPNQPQHVAVKEKDGSWLVEWTEPVNEARSRLFYQVSYHSSQDQGSSVLQNISEGSTSLSILGDSLDPSQQYQVRVRALVVLGEGTLYEGSPSEWTEAVGWTSHAATWSLSTLLYVFLVVLVAAVFFTLYFSIPACRRKVILWVESVPSPGKSKILSEIKSFNSQTPMQNEKTYTCRVQSLDTFSTCSSNASLWPSKNGGDKLMQKCEGEEEEGGWLTPPVDPSNASSSMSFTGPYIFCQVSESHQESEEVQHEGKDENLSAEASAPPPLHFIALHSDGYLCLPSHCRSRSTQDLVSYSHGNEQPTPGRDTQRRPQSTQWPVAPDVQPSIGESGDSDAPPAYTPGAFTPSPQGGAILLSGYCRLP